ncbi:hypothetical protein VPH35_035538 [Triticum aestivum]
MATTSWMARRRGRRRRGPLHLLVILCPTSEGRVDSLANGSASSSNLSVARAGELLLPPGRGAEFGPPMPWLSRVAPSPMTHLPSSCRWRLARREPPWINATGKEASVQHRGRAGRRRPGRAPPPAGSPDHTRPQRHHIGTSQEWTWQPPRAEQSEDDGV